MTRDSYPLDAERERGRPVHGDKARELMRATGLTIEKFGEAVNLDPRAITRVLSGKCVDPPTLKSFAQGVERHHEALVRKFVTPINHLDPIYPAFKRFIRMMELGTLEPPGKPITNLLHFFQVSSDSVFAELNERELMLLLELLLYRGLADQLANGNYIPSQVQSRDQCQDLIATRTTMEATCILRMLQPARYKFEMPNILDSMTSAISRLKVLLSEASSAFDLRKDADAIHRLHDYYGVEIECHIAKAGSSGCLREKLSRELRPCERFAFERLDLVEQVAKLTGKRIRLQPLIDECQVMLDENLEWLKLLTTNSSLTDLVNSSTLHSVRTMDLVDTVGKLRAQVARLKAKKPFANL